MFSVKKCQLFEGVSPSFGILAEHLKGPQNVHGVSKIDFLRNHQPRPLPVLTFQGHLNRLNRLDRPTEATYLVMLRATKPVLLLTSRETVSPFLNFFMSSWYS